MSTFPNRALIGWSFSRKKGLRIISLHRNGLANNYEPAKHLMFGRTGRVIKMWDGAQWNRVALWNQENKFGSSSSYTEITNTGRVILPVGGTAANTAPLKFTQDATSLLTAVEAGAMEYYNNSLWFTNLAVRRTVVQGQSVRTSSLTIANSTTETTLFTQPHGANYLKVGKMEQVNIYGQASSGSGVNDTATVGIKYAGTLLGSFTVPKSLSSAAFEIEVITTCRATGAGTTTMQVHANIDIEGVSAQPHYIGTVTGLDSTAAQATTVHWTWTSASASNTVTINQARALSIDNNG